jgi:hypothetical protein
MRSGSRIIWVVARLRWRLCSGGVHERSHFFEARNSRGELRLLVVLDNPTAQGSAALNLLKPRSTDGLGGVI